MSGIHKLHLEDALDESPQTRSLLGVFEEDASSLREYTRGLHACCHRVLQAQTEMVKATQSLSQQLKTYDLEKYPLESEGDMTAPTLQQFAVYVDELSSLHQILATQLSDGMMYPIGRFLQADLDEIYSMGEVMRMSTDEHEAALERYMKMSKKKSNEKQRQEVAEDIYAMKKKLHKTALHYYSALNALQYKRRSAILEPMVGYLRAYKSFSDLLKETAVRPEVDEFLGNITTNVNEVKKEMMENNQKAVELIELLETSSEPLYHVERPPEISGFAPVTSLAQKGGYLYHRTKSMLSTRWDRCYFFTQAGNLMCQAKDQVAGSLTLDLNEKGIYAEPIECDDRRNVFQVVSPSTKQTVILQAENENERDEWILTIGNIVRNSGYVKDNVRPDSKVESKSSPSKSSTVPIPALKNASGDSTGKSGPPATPPSTPQDIGLIPDAPIQFDIITPSEDGQETPAAAKEGPPRRVNPFDHNSRVEIVQGNHEDNSAFYETFEVRFLGSMQVRYDKGEKLIWETMRQIMAARAMHNIFRTTESLLVVSCDRVKLVDPSTNTMRVAYPLEDISYWTVHQENKRLFGLISRTRSATPERRPHFTCHVFECNTTGEEICAALGAVTRIAFQALMERKALEKHVKEQVILMENISKMEDLEVKDEPDASEEEPKISEDGRSEEQESSQLPEA